MAADPCSLSRKHLKIEDLLLRIQERDNMINVSSRVDVFRSNRSIAIPDMNMDDSDSGRCATVNGRPPCPRQHTIQPAHVTPRQKNKDLANQDEVSWNTRAPHEARRFIQNLDRNPDSGDSVPAGNGSLSPLKSSMRRRSSEQSARDSFASGRRVRFEASECQQAKIQKSASSACLSKVCKSVAKLLRAAIPVSLRKVMAARAQRRAIVDMEGRLS